MQFIQECIEKEGPYCPAYQRARDWPTLGDSLWKDIVEKYGVSRMVGRAADISLCLIKCGGRFPIKAYLTKHWMVQVVAFSLVARCALTDVCEVFVIVFCVGDH